MRIRTVRGAAGLASSPEISRIRLRATSKTATTHPRPMQSCPLGLERSGRICLRFRGGEGKASLGLDTGGQVLPAPFHDVLDGRGLQRGLDARDRPVSDQRTQAQDQAGDPLAGFLTLERFPLAEHGLEDLRAANQAFARASTMCATLAHASSSTNPTAPPSTSSRRAVRPTVSPCSGRSSAEPLFG